MNESQTYFASLVLVSNVHISMCHMSEIPDMTWSKHGPNHDDSSHIIEQIWPHPNIPAHIASSTILKQYNYNIIIFYIQSLTSFQEVGGFTITLLYLILESLRKWNQAIKYLHIIIIIFDKIGRNILP